MRALAIAKPCVILFASAEGFGLTKIEQRPMAFADHLVELRSRLLICIIATLLATIFAYLFTPDVLFPFITAPIDGLQGSNSQNPFVIHATLWDYLLERSGIDRAAIKLNYSSLGDPFLLRLKIAFGGGILLVLPIIVYQIWAFVSAGLYEHERRLVRIFGPVSFLLFLVGAALAYYIVLPFGIIFLVQQGQIFGLSPVLMINDYVPFVLWLLLGFGIVFQLPLVIMFLAKLGIVSARSLSQFRRYAILIVFIVAAVLTPPDPFTQVAMAIPMIGLYELSILLARLGAKK